MICNLLFQALVSHQIHQSSQTCRQPLGLLYLMFQDYHFNLMEVNPLIQTTEGKIIPLNTAQDGRPILMNLENMIKTS